VVLVRLLVQVVPSLPQSVQPHMRLLLELPLSVVPLLVLWLVPLFLCLLVAHELVGSFGSPLFYFYYKGDTQ
jgi:hypothetical protein